MMSKSTSPMSHRTISYHDLPRRRHDVDACPLPIAARSRSLNVAGPDTVRCRTSRKES